MNEARRGGLRPLSVMFDDNIAMLVSVSAVVYLLRALPPLLAPSGLLGGLIYLAVGVLAGISLAAAALVLIFLSCTEPRTRTSTHPAKPASVPPSPTSPLHPLSIAPRVRAAAKALLQYRKRGRYSGTVYLVPASRWPRDGALDDFPPPTSGPNAMATKWHAKLRGTKLTLAQEVSGRTHKVHINLEGCEVSVVREGLAAATHTRTIWWKKAPLEVAHPDRPLLFGESSLMLFAEHGGAKEQWYLALQWATSEGGLAKVVADLYAAYCANLRATSAVQLPRPQEATGRPEADPLQASHAASPTAGPITPRRRGWFRGIKAGNTSSRGTTSRRVSGSAPGLSPGSAAGGAGGPAEAAAGSPRPQPNLPVMDPDELDRRWMSSRRSSASAPAVAPPPGGARSSPGWQGGAQAAGSGVAARGSSVGQRSTGDSLPSLVDEDVENEDADAVTTSPPQRRPPPLAPLRISDPTSLTPSAASQPLPVSDPPASPSGRRRMRRSQSQPVQPGAHDAANSAALPGQDAGHREDPAAAPQPPPPQPTMPALHGVNMFLARAAFELLRSKPFEARVQEMIQRKLSDIRRPPYIQELTLSSLDMGATVPLIKSAHSLPPTSNAIWPQVQLEVSYPGTFSLTIETKLDLHKAPAFGRIERTLHHIRGPSRTQDEDELASNAGPGDLPPGAAADDRSGSAGRQGGRRQGTEGGGGGGRDGDQSSGDEGEEDEELEEAVNSGARERLASHTAQQLREQGQANRRRAPLLGVLRSGYKVLRRAAVDYAQQGLNNVARSLSLIPFQLDVHITRLEGKLLLWVPPPPSDRLWFSFVEPPDVVIRARPIIGNRVLKHSITFMLNRVSDWFERKLLRALRKNLVLPACGDIRLVAFASLEASLFTRHLTFSTHTTADNESDSSADASDTDDQDPAASPSGPNGLLPVSAALAGAQLLVDSQTAPPPGDPQSAASAPSHPATHRPSSPLQPERPPQASVSLTHDRPPQSAPAGRPTPSALLDPHIQAELHTRLPLLSPGRPGSSCSSATIDSPSPSPTVSGRGSPSAAARSPGGEGSGPLAAIARRSKKMKEKKERRREERQQRERQLEQEAWERGEALPAAPKLSPRKLFFRGSRKLYRNRSQSMTEAAVQPSGGSLNSYEFVRPTRSLADMSNSAPGNATSPYAASLPDDDASPAAHYPDGYALEGSPLSPIDHAELAPESYSPLAPYSPHSYYSRAALHPNPFANSRPGTDSPRTAADAPAAARPSRALKQTLSSLSPRSRRSTTASNPDVPSAPTTTLLDAPPNPAPRPPTAPDPIPTPFQQPPPHDLPPHRPSSSSYNPPPATALLPNPLYDLDAQPGTPLQLTDDTHSPVTQPPRGAPSPTPAPGQQPSAGPSATAPGSGAAFWKRANAAVTAAGAAVAATGKAVAARAPIPAPSPEQSLGRWRAMLGDMLKAKGEGEADGPLAGQTADGGYAVAPAGRSSF